MAKAKTNAKTATKGSNARRKTRPGKAAVGKSGVMPEIGAARAEATGPLATRRTASRAPSPRKAKAQLPGEKAVAKTNQTVPVEPERSAIGRGEREPMPAPAVDRRRQIVGTDDPRSRPAR